HTPGHTDGHVSLWRPHDRVLVAGDALITVKQESMLAVLAQWRALHGPPAYFTTDWRRTELSVRALAALQPDLLIPGHGRPMRGAALTSALGRLVREFDDEVPARGRYVAAPARPRGPGYQLPPDPPPGAAAR